MKKLKSIPVIYVIITILASLYVISCKEDNPVTTPPDEPYQYDSARFNWKVDTLDYYFAPIELSCIDTNDIYFLDIYRTLIHYDGNEFETQFLPYSVLGISIKANSDKVFIGGLYLNSSKYDRPALIIKENNIFTEVQIPDSNQKYTIISIERTSEDVLWLGTDKGKLLKYESGKFTFFQFDTTYYIDVFKDKNENIFTLNRREIYNSNGTKGEKYLEVYKYENNNFTRLYSKFFPNIDEYTLTTNIFNGELYSMNIFAIQKFNGSDFINIIENSEIAPAQEFSGGSSSDILIRGIIKANTSRKNLFHWNGYKWSIEIPMYLNGSFDLSEKISDKYVYVKADDPIRTYIYIGSPKIK